MRDVWRGRRLVAFAAAVDSWRALGSGLTSTHVVMRRGVLARRTVALERAGIVGWIGTRTYFQRRVGLMTLTASTDAGSSANASPDVATPVGIALADEAIPGLLEAFIERAANVANET